MVRRIFIYGRFLEENEANPSFPLPFILPKLPEPELSTEAIEILRELSLFELIGKVYVLTSSRNYQAVTPLGVRNFDWFKQYQQASEKKEKFYFKAKEGDLWRVPWMRLESDDSGSYIAVGLKHD
jgi:hypothetical protein